MSFNRRLKILLIDALGSFPYNSPEPPKICIAPVGLLYLSSSLKKHLGNSVETKVLDLSLRTYSKEKLQTELLDFSPDLVGIRVLSVFLEIALHVIKTTREILPDSFIVAGGAATDAYLSELLLGDNPAHLAVLGEGEISLARIAETLIYQEDPFKVPGIAYVKGEK